MLKMKIYRNYSLLIFICHFKAITCKNVNVLIFILDDLRPALGCFGDQNAYSPNIDRLSVNSLVFQNAFAQQALCAPSRNSILTSRRPDTLHLYDFYNYWRDFAGNFTTLPQYFKENGYHTMSVGKVFHPGISSNYSDDQPYSWSSVPFHPPSEIYKNARVCFTEGNPFPQKNLVCPVSVDEQPGRTLPDIESAEKAIEFIQGKQYSTKPFFLAVGFHKPHIPLKYPVHFKKYHPLENVVLPLKRRKPPDLPNVAWNPWTDLREREDIIELNISFPFGIIEDEQAKFIIQSYYASVSYVDDLIGQILSQLARSNLDKNTIIGLIGDHGWSLGEHGEWSKFSNFDVATRVPFILKVPGLTTLKYNKQGSAIIKEPVELLDLFPTLVDLVGLKPIKTCNPKYKENLCTEGKSLLPLIMDKLHLTNGKKSRHWKTYAFSQYPRPGEYPTEKPNSDKPKLNEITIMGCSLRTKRYRYTEWVGFKKLTIIWEDLRAAELYDSKLDPYESTNLIYNETYTTVRKRLSLKLRKNWKKV